MQQSSALVGGVRGQRGTQSGIYQSLRNAVLGCFLITVNTRQ